MTSRPRRQRLGVFVGLAALLVVTAACGSDDDNAADTTAGAAAPATAAPTTAASASATTEAEASSAPETSAAGAGDTTIASSAAGGDAADLKALIAAAKEEGSVSWMTALPTAAAQRAADGFKAEYGITVEFIEITGNQLMQRYSTEAEAGSPSADIINVAGGGGQLAFLQDGIKKGWLQSLDEAALPIMTSGDFPADFDRGKSATISVLPWLIAYNSDSFSADEAPATFEEMGLPKYKDKLDIVDPAASDAYVQLWLVARKAYGQAAIKAIAANNPRFYDSSGPGFQALAAGEGGILGPAVASSAKAVQEAGAPVQLITPPITSGVEMQLMLTATDKAKSPNAAKLLANWLMTEEGNLILTGDDTVSIYDTAKLPAGYESPPAFTDAEKAEILAIFGR